MYINVCESGLARGVVQKKYFFVTQLFLVCDESVQSSKILPQREENHKSKHSTLVVFDV